MLRWFVGLLGIWLRSRAWHALTVLGAGLLLVVIYIYESLQGIYNATLCNQRVRRNLCIKIVYALDSWDATATTTTTKPKILFMSSARTVKSKSSAASECRRSSWTEFKTDAKRRICRKPKSSGETNWIAPRYNIFMYSMFLCIIRNVIERQA